jgi:hypothetical protein
MKRCEMPCCLLKALYFLYQKKIKISFIVLKAIYE